MTTLVTHIIPAIFLLLLPFSQALSQNLFSAESTKKYADHLYYSGEYQTAYEEYARLSTLIPSNDSLQAKKISCLLKSGQFQFAAIVSQQSLFQFPESPQLKELGAKSFTLYSKTDSILFPQCIAPIVGEQDLSLLMLARKILTSKRRMLLRLSSSLSNESKPSDKKLKDMLEVYKFSKHRSPALAGVLSTIVPGAGKIYTGRYNEAWSAFSLTLSAAFCAYRGFEKRGKESIYGWIFSGVTLGFYSGNIYGAIKSAVQYNRKTKNRLTDEATMFVVDM